MTVGVFGASGFIGRQVVDELLKQDRNVIPCGRRQNPIRSDVDYRKCDVNDRRKVDEITCESDDLVLLFASSMRESREDPVRNMRVNINGLLNILESARKNDVRRIVFTSTIALFSTIEYLPLDENHTTSPGTPYGVSKLAGEHYTRLYGELYGIDYAVFRLCNVYGPGQYPGTGGIIPLIHRAIKTDSTFFVNGDGTSERDYIYVSDVASYIVGALDLPEANFLANLGTGKSTSINRLIEISESVVGKKMTVEHRPPVAGEICNFTVDNSLLKKKYKRSPPTDIRTGIAKTFEWLDSTESALRDHHSANIVNLQTSNSFRTSHH